MDHLQSCFHNTKQAFNRMRNPSTTSEWQASKQQTASKLATCITNFHSCSLQEKSKVLGVNETGIKNWREKNDANDLNNEEDKKKIIMQTWVGGEKGQC